MHLDEALDMYQILTIALFKIRQQRDECDSWRVNLFDEQKIVEIIRDLAAHFEHWDFLFKNREDEEPEDVLIGWINERYFIHKDDDAKKALSWD